MYEINSVKQLLYNNDVVYRCGKSHQLIIAQCNIHRHLWSSSSDMLLHSHSLDRYKVQVNECVMTHARPQVNVITYTFLVLTSFLCSTGTAGLRRHTAFSISTPSPLRLFRCFPILSESVLLHPMSNMFLCINSTIAMDSAINQDIYSAHRDINHYTYRIWQSSNLRR